MKFKIKSMENINNDKMQLMVNFNENMQKYADITTQSILNNEYELAYNYIMKMEKGEAKNNAIVNFIKELSNACYHICIYNTPEVIEHLNRTILTENETKWIIPTTELEKVLSEIEKNKNYILNREMTLMTIQQYLLGKIWVALIEKFRIRFTLSTEQSVFDYLLQNLKNTDRRKNNKEMFDTIWRNLKSLVNPYLSILYGVPKELLSHFQNIKSKESDKILLQIFHDYLLPVSINVKEKNNIKLRLMFPLYALILKERKWQISTYMFGKKKGQIDYREIDKIMWKFIYKR